MAMVASIIDPDRRPLGLALGVMVKDKQSFAGSLILALAGVVFLALPWASATSASRGSVWVIIVCCLPSAVLFGIAFFGSKSLRQAVAEFLPWSI